MTGIYREQSTKREVPIMKNVSMGVERTIDTNFVRDYRETDESPSEIDRAMVSLHDLISSLQALMIQLEEKLRPILSYLDEPSEEDNVGTETQTLSCELGREIEKEYWRLGILYDRINLLLRRIQL